MSEKIGKVVVYRARNLVNGHTYIGFTSRGLPARERQHRAAARQSRGFHFHNAIRKYGQENFVFEVLMDFLDDEELAKVYEWEMISKHKPEYNLSAGGEGGTMHESTRKKVGDANRGRPSARKGMPLTEEHKAAIAAANKGQGLGRKGAPLSEAHKQRLREANLGNKHSLGKKLSDEAKAKIGAAHRGRVSVLRGVPRSEETKQKLRAANKGQVSHNKGKTASAETRQRMSESQKLVPWVATEARLSALSVSIKAAQKALNKRTACLNDGRVFASAKEAGEFYGLNPKLVRQSIPRGHAVRGFRFKYEEVK